METDELMTTKFGITPEQAIGYVYSGLLAALYAAILEPKKVTELINTLGNFLSILIVLGIGMGIYVFYFKILGEGFLYPLFHLYHGIFDWIRGKTGNEHTSCTAFLGHLGVSLSQRRAAYEAIKAMYYKSELRRRIQLSHGENHVLYITAIESIIALIYASIKGKENVISWLWLALISYFGTIVSDIRQHSLETHILKSIGKEDLVKFLKDGGYIDQEYSSK